MSKTILNRTQGALAKSSITQDLRSWKRLMKNFTFLLFMLCFGLAANTYSQSVIVKGGEKKSPKKITSESKLLADFVDSNEQKQTEYSPKVLKFMLDKVINLRVDTVIIRYPKKFGGTSIGYSLISSEKAKLRQKELDNSIRLLNAKTPEIVSTSRETTNVTIR